MSSEVLSPVQEAASTDISSSDSDDYDTDLEIQPEPAKIPREKRLVKSAMRYESACKRVGIPAQTTVLQNIDRSELRIRHRNLGPTAIRALAMALEKNMTIDVLDLADTGIDIGVKKLAEKLAKNQCATKVDLSNNNLDTVGAWCVSEILANNQTIKELYLSGNNFREEAGLYLGIGIQKNCVLKHLDISHNCLSENGAVYVGKAIAENFGMTSLNVSWNYIRGKGAVGFCKGVQENGTLRQLDISWNGLGYEGALSMRQLLKANTTLCVLDISNNKINWQGARMIAEGLGHNQALTTLKIGQNPLTTTGCMDIIEAVSSKGCALQNLDLTDVMVIGEFELMAAAIQQSRDFHFKHGGVVNSHDILGQRFGRRIEPMQKVIDYMNSMGLRPVDLFRILDKEVSSKLDHSQLIERIKKCGVDLPKHEIVELLDHIESNGVDNDVTKGEINYKKMVNSVHDQLDKERVVKIRERERQKRLGHYHKDILSLELPPIDSEDVVPPPKAIQRMESTMSLSSTATHLTRQDSQRPVKLMSMSTKLGGKTKAFGTADVKKRKKKKRKSRK